MSLLLLLMLTLLTQTLDLVLVMDGVLRLAGYLVAVIQHVDNDSNRWITR